MSRSIRCFHPPTHCLNQLPMWRNRAVLHSLSFSSTETYPACRSKTSDKFLCTDKQFVAVEEVKHPMVEVRTAKK